MRHDVLQAGVALFERHLCLCVPAVFVFALAAGLLLRRQLTLCAVPSRWLSAAGCAAPQERLRSCATRTGGSSCFTSGHSCLRRCQKQPRPRRLRLLAVLGYIFFLWVCDASRRRRGLPRRLYGRGAARRASAPRTSPWLAGRGAASILWESSRRLVSGRIPGALRHSYAYSIKASTSILLDIIEN